MALTTQLSTGSSSASVLTTSTSTGLPTPTFTVKEFLTPTDYPWYSIQDAFTDTRYGSDAKIWANGCQLPRGGWNCTAACLDMQVGPSYLWTQDNATYTLQNCLIYPFIAAALAAGTLSQDPPNLAEKYNIQPNSNLSVLNSMDGWPVINQCIIKGYCGPSGPGAKIDGYCLSNDTWNETDFNWYPSPGFLPENFTTYAYDQFCDYNDASMNPDVGGIGVVASYMIQIIILLVIWLTQSICTHWVKFAVLASPWARLPFWLSRRRASPSSRDWNSRLHQAVRSQKRLSDSDLYATLVTGLVEFQKTQIFFIVTIQIACLIALHHTKLVQAESWISLWANLRLFFQVAMSGMDPIILGLFLLRKAGKTSKYLLVSSTICVIVSLITWFTNGTVNNNPTAIQPTKVDSVCGGYPDPTVFCLFQQQKFRGYSFMITSSQGYEYITGLKVTVNVLYLSVAICILIAMILEKITAFPGKSTGNAKVNVYEYTHIQLERHAHHLVTTTASDLGSVATWFAEAWLIWCNFIDLFSYTSLLQFTQAHVWSLGQIISIGVWVPVIVEFIYLNLEGMEDGFMYKLIHPYHVTKQDDGRPGSPSGQATHVPLADTTHATAGADDTGSSSAYELIPSDAGGSHALPQAKTWSPIV